MSTPQPDDLGEYEIFRRVRIGDLDKAHAQDVGKALKEEYGTSNLGRRKYMPPEMVERRREYNRQWMRNYRRAMRDKGARYIKVCADCGSTRIVGRMELPTMEDFKDED